MKTIEERMIEVLDETIAYYSENPDERRSVDPVTGNCCYNTVDGKSCAVGRLCNEEQLKFLHDECEGQKASGSISYMKHHVIIDAESPLSLPFAFLNMLQNLHDNAAYWINGGLSDRGQNIYKSVRNNIAKGAYTPKSTVTQ